MKKILFVYDHKKPEQLEGDGLWTALLLLEDDFEIKKWNISEPPSQESFDFVLGWGSFESRVDKAVANMTAKKGLCLGGMLKPNETASNYDIIFYETEAHKRFLEEQGVKTKMIHAFGINTDIYHRMLDVPAIWDNISVGSFSPWHRQDNLYDLTGNNIAVGNIEGDNIQESFNYVANLLIRGWTISNFVRAETLAKFYNMSKKCYLTAEFGQERACLEARACGLEVIAPLDNPKLQELLTSPIYDVQYYYEQLKGGILDALRT